ELLMHRAVAEGVMPEQMSYSGWNFDILTGIGATLLLPFANRAPAWLLRAWNLLGIALLTNILVIAVVSTPLVAAFGPDRVTTFVPYPPYVWLASVLVGAAITGHILLIRRLGVVAGSARLSAVAPPR